MKPFKQVIVGTYRIGIEEVQLILRSGNGGEFYFTPETGRCARIKVGADNGWSEVVSGLLHEALEMQMTRSHCRFEPAPDFSRDHSSYLFVMNHPMFSDVVGRVAKFVSESLPDLGREWKKFHRKTKSKKR